MPTARTGLFLPSSCLLAQIPYISHTTCLNFVLSAAVIMPAAAKKYNFLKLSFLFITLIFLIPKFNDSTQHFFNLKKTDLSEIENQQNKKLKTNDLYILNSNIFGTRLNHKQIDTDRLSVSKNFINYELDK